MATIIVFVYQPFWVSPIVWNHPFTGHPSHLCQGRGVVLVDRERTYHAPRFRNKNVPARAYLSNRLRTYIGYLVRFPN